MGPVHNAARRGNLTRVKELLNRGYAHLGVNSQNAWRSWTPLHSAVNGAHMNVVQELLRRGARVNLRTTNGATPLDMAMHELTHGNLHRIVRRRYMDIVQTLQEAGARVNTAGRTATPDAAAVRAPNYSKASKHLKKWLEARPHEIRMNQVNVKLPEGASDPISLKNFNKGNEAIMVLKKDVRNGALRTKRYFLEKNVLARLAKKPWRSILRMKASDAVFKDPINRRTVYRRNLMNVKFI